MSETSNRGSTLLSVVHDRIGLGVDITTWIDGTVEIRWKRDYGDEGWSDERFAQADSIEGALMAVLEHERLADEADE